MKTQPAAALFRTFSALFGQCGIKTLSLILCSVGLILFAPRAGAGVLYASTASGAAGELYIMDPATGSVVTDIGPLNDSLGTNYGITGLAFHPVTGVLYGSTANSDTNVQARLVKINPTNALVTVIGPFNAGNTGTKPATMSDLAFSADGTLYGIGSAGGPQLYSIDLTSGQATVIGTTGLTSTSGGGLAIDASGVFYGTPTASRFGTYDPVSGGFTVIANPDKPLGGAYAALAFDENGVLFGLESGSGSPPPNEIVTFDLATGALLTSVASINSLDAIAFLPVPKPQLSIVKIGTQVTLRWPDLPGFNLEFNTNLSAGTWQTNSVPPTSSGGTNSLTLTSAGFAKYFRLHKP